MLPLSAVLGNNQHGARHEHCRGGPWPKVSQILNCWVAQSGHLGRTASGHMKRPGPSNELRNSQWVCARAREGRYHHHARVCSSQGPSVPWFFWAVGILGSDRVEGTSAAK